jgi:arsenite methyltransferase
MEQSDCQLPGHTLPQPDSLFERVSWFYALCREYLFRDHTPEIVQSLFPYDPPAPGTRLLELGCGPGFYACRVSEELPNVQIIGIDLSHKLIERATSRARSRQLPNCSFQHADAHDLPFDSNSIDAIVVSRLFLIVADKQRIVDEIFRVLKPSGRCFIAEPTSGFRTRFPLTAMWLLARISTSPAGEYREPQQADVMSRPDFKALVHSRNWGTINLQYDQWYQYAVCQKMSPEHAP